ncbi:MAG: HEAT repeat domain-containing protein [Spirochaetaceae bacterium]|nr:HEAT repeat domain-containing protein [Spirochaetaceae bacterium]MDT8298613.1 HEAT repeat domain-containing protein [Spirochaetaceae bacterium]
MKIRAIQLIIVLILIGLPLGAQESEQTIEELYLQSAIKTQIIKAEAASPDRDMKMIALTDIALMVNDGTANDNPEILEVLGNLAGEGITNVVREQGHVQNDFPDVRREAARVLGQLGTEEAAQQLNTILLTDPEPMVMSEAILAISNIDVEDKNSRNRSMAAAIYRQTAVNKDNNFAYTFLQSIENVATREGGVSDPMIFEEVAKIADARNGYNRVVRERAFQLLRDLQDL